MKTILRWNETQPKILLKGSSLRSAFEKGEIAYYAYEPEKAVVHYEECLRNLSSLSEKARPVAERLLQRRIIVCQQESALKGKDWVNLITPDSVTEWKCDFGQISSAAENELEVKSGIDGFLILSDTRVGPNFEIQGEVEFIESTNGQYQGGIAFGIPGDDSSYWMTFSWRINAEQELIVELRKALGSSIANQTMPLQLKNHFHVLVRDQKATLLLNGKPLWQDLKIPDNRAVTNPNQMIALAGFFDQNETTVRYRKLQVRRLPTEPPASTSIKDK